MSTHEDFPAELVEARANELERVWLTGGLPDRWIDAARLSLRREVEACEPLVKALDDYADVLHDERWIATAAGMREAVAVHRARYAPKPETLADVAREAAEALSGNAALSARLLAAVEREKGGAK